jgi:hypothetical protein
MTPPPVRSQKPQRWRAWPVVLAGVLYAMMAAAFGLAGAVPLAPALLPLAPENYHFWEMAFVLPLFVLGWLLVSAFAKVLGRLLGGKGTYKATAAAMATALSVPLLFVWFFQSAIAVLMLLGMGQAEFADLVSAPGLWQTLFLAYHALGAAGLLTLAVRALARAQKLGWGRALIAGALAGGLFLLFIAICVR